ncbi:hypothetical protein D7M11_09110 [Paenibacillus ginsengarvi]|uniref:Uncharacterized protein n=1 Tax=Paenibacillus ginsengarvi TaxID=400777 RepID=A0A3B0CLJ9_9BACL|nr:hypothetical protein D7M11_09110 [Paenibacillus ginsengarvi]
MRLHDAVLKAFHRKYVYRRTSKRKAVAIVGEGSFRGVARISIARFGRKFFSVQKERTFIYIDSEIVFCIAKKSFFGLKLAEVADFRVSAAAFLGSNMTRWCRSS